jgi:hypothetical protein
VKFFFADSQDMVDPTFDFQTETRTEWRIRQRDDLYPHELYRTPPYDGILVSKAMVDGNTASGGRYSLAQRQRLWRQGVHAFFRTAASLETMGDCGAFSYIREQYPPFTPDEVIDFYEHCNFDYGISVDHVIFGFQSSLDDACSPSNNVPPEWSRRQEITLALADEFARRCLDRKVHFIPLGVAQGWSPTSYALAVNQLQKMGYQHIALGGMVPLATHAILQCLEAISAVRRPDTALHLLGVTRCEHVTEFQKYGVTSFDSTSPFRQAFKDEKDNYYTMERTYLAIRVPQSEGNAQLQARIRSGELQQETVRRLEERCLRVLLQYDQGEVSVETALKHVLAYERIHHPKEDRSRSYREVLEDRPWAHCSCSVCRKLGIHVIIFRGAERNKRRGFHNLSVFYARLQRELATPASSEPSVAGVA